MVVVVDGVPTTGLVVVVVGGFVVVVVGAVRCREADVHPSVDGRVHPAQLVDHRLQADEAGEHVVVDGEAPTRARPCDAGACAS